MSRAERGPSRADRAVRVDPTLRRLATAAGPVMSMYLGTPGDIVHAAQHAETRWRALREHLAAQGVPEDALFAVDPEVADAYLVGRGLCVIAGAEGARHVEHLPDPPLLDHAWWEPLPALLPLLRRRQSEPPFVLVRTDRRGADISAYGPEPVADESVDPDPEDPDRKLRGGGWAHRRFQQRAENTWDARAKDVAEHVERACEAVQAELVLVGGDVRAVQLLEEHLPERWRAVLEELPGGGRAQDGSDEVEADAIRRWVQTAAARRVVAVLEKYREELGQHDRAVGGPTDTRRALERGQVATLLVHDDWLDDRRVEAGDDLEVGPDGQPPRLVDLVIRDALATDATVMVVPRHGGPPEGIGALLRWA